MRCAPRSMRLVVGLSIAVLQLAIGLSPANGWGWGPSDSQTVDVESLPSMGGPSVTTSVDGVESRWTNDRSLSQVPPGRMIVDRSVQQAAWAEPTQGGMRPAGHPKANAPRGSSAQTGRKGPMIHGLQLRLPSLFGRSQSTASSPAMVSSPRQRSDQPRPDDERPTAGRQTTSRFAANPAMQDRAGAVAYVPQVAKIPQYRAAMAGPSTPANRLRQLPQGQNMRATSVSNAMASDATGDREPDVAPQSLTPAQTATAMPVPTEAASIASTKQRQTSDGSPSHSRAAEKLAAMAHQWSETAESEADYTKIIETCRRVQASSGPAWLTAYVQQLAGWSLNRRGQLKAETGFVQEALLDFDDAVRADPTCWRAIHNRGVLLAQDGHFEKAFDDFNRAIELSPEFAKAYSNRGALYVVADDLPAALADYARAIELDPNLAIAHRGCGRVCHLLGQLDKAIGHYDAAVQLAPDDGYAVASRADLLTDLGRYANAMADYNLAIEIDPHSAHAYSGSAWLLATCPDDSVRNPKLAIERARMAIELSGREDAVSFDTLAAAQASAGDFSTAAQTVRQAINLAAADERDIYRDRLMLYQHAKPYRIAPLREVTQVSYAGE